MYGTLAVDGVFDGVMELSQEEYSVERADRYLSKAEFPSVMYRHSDISTTGLINSSICLSDLLHEKYSAQKAYPLRQQPFSTSQEQVGTAIPARRNCFWTWGENHEGHISRSPPPFNPALSPNRNRIWCIVALKSETYSGNHFNDLAENQLTCVPKNISFQEIWGSKYHV